MSLYVNFSLTLHLPRDPPYVPGVVSRGIRRSATAYLHLMPRLITRTAVRPPDLRVPGIVHHGQGNFNFNFSLQNFIFCWPCILMQFWVMNNLMHSFLMYLFMPLHVSSSKCSSSGGPNCINTSSGITLCYTRWCINTIWPSWWSAIAARNM
jgi:hypothetical protein